VTESQLQPALDAALDALGLRYAVVGGLAVGACGVPRATKDADLYAELAAALRPRLQQELLQRDFDVPAMEEELERLGVFRSLFRPTSVFVDIFDADNPLGEAILKRRREVRVQFRPWREQDRRLRQCRRLPRRHASVAIAQCAIA